jgi:glutamine transport system permease protein
MSFQWSAVVDALPALLLGAKLTIIITIAGLIGGSLLGAAAGMMRAYGGPVLNGIALTYIEFIRGTTMMVQVMFIYFALPMLAGIRIEPVSAAIIAIVINAGAYIAEIVRGAFLSVGKGLREAGLALGLPTWKVLAYVIGPLAFRRMIPALGNQFIISLKDTSLFIVIGVGELTSQGQDVMSTTFRAVEVWSAVAILYLLMTGSLTVILRIVEGRMRIL